MQGQVLIIMPKEKIDTTLVIQDLLTTMISNLIPFDNLERQHIHETLNWIQSNAPLFRLQKPDIPPKHLVSYFILWDEIAREILLVDHKKAQLWLPGGGHIDVQEHPRQTVIRECREELGIEAEFWHPEPLFLTSTITRGLTPGHTDVSLWYLLKGRIYQPLIFDPQEFNTVRWFSLDQIPYEKADPHMKRFITKMENFSEINHQPSPDLDASYYSFQSLRPRAKRRGSHSRIKF